MFRLRLIVVTLDDGAYSQSAPVGAPPFRPAYLISRRLD